MEDRAAIAWVARRTGFGLAPGQLDQLAGAGLSTTLDQWLEPSSHGVPAATDPWEGLDLFFTRPAGVAFDPNQIIGAWLQAMVSTPRPFEEWMRWFWHGHFVTTLRQVRSTKLLRYQLGTLGRFGLGDFPTLLRTMTTDPAMLLYLNGNTNQAGAINENYGREVLELFALGIGNYTETDVRAGAVALTGWVVDPGGGSRFVPRRHEQVPQTYLGRTGVHDVDTVVDAIVNHPACGPFITGQLARAVLGPSVAPGLITSLAKGFVASGLQLRPLARAIVEAGIDGASGPLIAAPVPWSMAMARATGVAPATVKTSLARSLPAAGQVPLDAPNVGGWPGGPQWLSASATLARYDLAGALATAAAPTTPVAEAAVKGDWAALADALGHPAGFAPATVASLRALPAVGRRPEVARMALAVSAPDMVVG